MHYHCYSCLINSCEWETQRNENKKPMRKVKLEASRYKCVARLLA